jgi:putative transposase
VPQSLSNLLVHIIFSTKDREPLLRDPAILADMHRYLGGLVAQQGGKCLTAGGVADHVHLLVVLPRTMPASDLVRELKRGSSLWAKRKDISLKHFAWQTGYGAFSVGQGEVEVVRNYILKQEEHHRKKTFEEEYLAFLHKYGIGFDERYLWD